MPLLNPKIPFIEIIGHLIVIYTIITRDTTNKHVINADVQLEIIKFLETKDARSPERAVNFADLEPYADDPWEIIEACLRLVDEKKVKINLDGIYLYCKPSVGL